MQRTNSVRATIGAGRQSTAQLLAFALENKRNLYQEWAKLQQSRRQHLTRIAAYLGAVFVPPGLWRGVSGSRGAGEGEERTTDKQSWLRGGKVPFDKGGVRQMARERPEFVFLGDSMVRAWIDAPLLAQLSGRRVSALWQPNSTSARWYAMLKNYVIRSGVQPRCVIVLFRDSFLHMPTYKVDGPFWDDLERCMPKLDDPVIRRVLGTQRRRSSGRLAELLREGLYPIQHERAAAEDAIETLAAALTGSTAEQVKQEANARFDFQQFRRGINVEMGAFGGHLTVPFTTDTSRTFLPHMVDLAGEAGIRLFFIRVKRRPGPDGVTSQSAELLEYMTRLRGWLAEHRIGFHDFTDDASVTEAMYAEGDHLATTHTAWFSRRLFDALGGTIFR